MTTRDPVCGMMVESDRAAGRSTYEGETYYFCSIGCREQFDAGPERYLTQAGDRELEKHEPPRTTKGPMTAPKFGSAGSGGAEYERVPEIHEKK